MPIPQPQEITAEVNAAVTADVDAAVAAATGLRLMGYSARESAGSPAIAAAMIVNGATGAAVGKVAHVALLASSGETVWFGEPGIPCPLGISIDHLAGQLEVILYYRTAP